ncbi:hypothetical protein WKT22_04441 [Candidatus Lokiarchaeum ossiferum]
MRFSTEVKKAGFNLFFSFSCLFGAKKLGKGSKKIKNYILDKSKPLDFLMEAIYDILCCLVQNYFDFIGNMRLFGKEFKKKGEEYSFPGVCFVYCLALRRFLRIMNSGITKVMPIGIQKRPTSSYQ